MLTCTCYNPDDAEWYWYAPNDYTTLTHKRRCWCKSCNAQIDIGAICAEITRSRGPKDEIEERIYGEDNDAVLMSSWWLCERCADLYFSLTELGYCVDPADDMRELVKEYAEIQAETRRQA